MEEHAVHQKCVHVLQDGLVTIVNKVSRDVGMSDIYLQVAFIYTQLSVLAVVTMEEHAVHQKCVHVLQDGLLSTVNKVNNYLSTQCAYVN